MEVSSQSSNTSVDNKLKCTICGKKYSKKSNLKKHVASVHTETHRFQCRNCEVYFSENATLQKHLNRQICLIKKDKKLKEITYDCKVCKRKFGARHVLNLHIKQNHPENYYKYNCSQCDVMFSSKKGLHGHVDTVHNNNKPKCLICGLEFYDKYKLNRHIENVHSPNAMKKRDEKLAARSEAELNREVYRKLKSDPCHTLVNSTVDPSEHYYLKLNKKQRERVNIQKMLKPVVKEPVIGQHHIRGWGYTSEGNECPINYVKLTDEQRRSSHQVYGYVWRDGKTFEIVEVYYGMTCDTAINGAIVKWTKIKASTDKGCSDRRMYDDGHFFCPEEAFLIEGMVGHQKWVVGQLKWLTRNEAGGICSVNPKECYKWLDNYVGQIREALTRANHLWLDHPDPNIPTSNSQKNADDKAQDHDLEEENRTLQALLSVRETRIEQLESDMEMLKTQFERDIQAKEEERKTLLQQLRDTETKLENERENKVAVGKDRKKRVSLLSTSPYTIRLGISKTRRPLNPFQPFRRSNN